MMTKDEHRQRIWDSDWRRGRSDSTLAAAARLYRQERGSDPIGAAVQYASTLYSALNDDYANIRLGKRLYWLHALLIAAKLWWHLRTVRRLASFAHVSGYEKDWTLPRLEASSSILLKFGGPEGLGRRILGKPWFQTEAYNHRRVGRILIAIAGGVLQVTKPWPPEDHNPFLLFITDAKDMLTYCDERIDEGESVEDARHYVVDGLEHQMDLIHLVADKNQQARIYRGFGTLWKQLGRSDKEKECFDLAEAVPGIGESVRLKNEAARR